MPSLSVVVPVRNCAQYVTSALESVRRQGFDDHELIVVDDGSTDGTPAVLEGYRAGARIITRPHGGVAAARNAGVAAASGRYVAFLDGDDWWLDGRLAIQFAALARWPRAAIAFSDFCVAGEDGTIERESGIRWKYRSVRRAEESAWERLFSHAAEIEIGQTGRSENAVRAYCGDISGWLFRGNFVNTSSVLVRRDALMAAGGFDESLETEEDYACWLALARLYEAVYVDAPLVAFRRRPGQLTARGRSDVVIRNVAIVVERAARSMAGVADRRTISARLADVRRDLGISYLRQGKRREARHWLVRSFWHWPPDMRSATLLAFTFMPTSAFLRCFDWMRSLAGRFRQTP